MNDLASMLAAGRNAPPANGAGLQGLAARGFVAVLQAQKNGCDCEPCRLLRIIADELLAALDPPAAAVRPAAPPFEV